MGIARACGRLVFTAERRGRILGEVRLMSIVEVQPGDWVRVLDGEQTGRRGRVIAVGLSSVRISVKAGHYAYDPVVEVRLRHGQFRILKTKPG